MKPNSNAIAGWLIEVAGHVVTIVIGGAVVGLIAVLFQGC
jgi:hypothetical protein